MSGAPRPTGASTERTATERTTTERTTEREVRPRLGGHSTDPLAPYGYHTQSPIAAGAFATVVRAKAVKSGEEVAVKSFVMRARAGKAPPDLEAVRTELEALRVLQPSHHEHIANILEVHENDDVTHAILEYCGGGSVAKYVGAQGHGVGLKEEEAAFLAAQVGAGLAHMHALGVTHRDVKPDNVIFIDRAKQRVRLVDFGFAANHAARGRLSTVCGSPAYMAPEIVSGKPYLGPPVDVWALGNMIYELMHSKPAFRAESIAQLNTCIRRANHAQFNQKVSKAARAIIKRAFTLDASERPDAATLTQSLIETYTTPKTVLTEAMAALMENQSTRRREQIAGSPWG